MSKVKINRCKAIRPVPSENFLKELVKMTDNNDHGGVYLKVAQWCLDIFEKGIVENPNDKKWIHRVNKLTYATNLFKMYVSIFSAMNDCHMANGDFYLGEERYTVGKQMEDDIRTFLGEECYKAFHEREMVYGRLV